MNSQRAVDDIVVVVIVSQGAVEDVVVLIIVIVIVVFQGAVEDGTRGQCRDDNDCVPWAPSCSPLGYCR